MSDHVLNYREGFTSDNPMPGSAGEVRPNIGSGAHAAPHYNMGHGAAVGGYSSYTKENPMPGSAGEVNPPVGGGYNSYSKEHPVPGSAGEVRPHSGVYGSGGIMGGTPAYRPGEPQIGYGVGGAHFEQRPRPGAGGEVDFGNVAYSGGGQFGGYSAQHPEPGSAGEVGSGVYGSSPAGRPPGCEYGNAGMAGPHHHRRNNY
ncbi:unnamed protein product [Caenorhabditis auriculariae]|uniref:Uncharacterized protein n=1 Tax=Caenorhabditis auriculariae TaxID=2777116 RepID=A0A8S1GVZ5_9PELO|nr:unnamed protein product [Caenorhabditis auriculariae]